MEVWVFIPEQCLVETHIPHRGQKCSEGAFLAESLNDPRQSREQKEDLYKQEQEQQLDDPRNTAKKRTPKDVQQ